MIEQMIHEQRERFEESTGKKAGVLVVSEYAYRLLKDKYAMRMVTVEKELWEITEYMGMKIERLTEDKYEPKIIIQFKIDKKNPSVIDYHRRSRDRR